MSISYHLKALLADANMTQKELAEATGVRPPTISAICLGTIKQFPVGALDKICEVLHCRRYTGVYPGWLEQAANGR